MIGEPVRVRARDAPAVLDREGAPIPGLRAKSVELLLYLAQHRAGADLTAILTDIWPGVDTERANQRLSTCLGNLRGVLRKALDTTVDTAAANKRGLEPVVNTGSGYRLNPNLVTVDIWHTAPPAGPPARRHEPAS